MEEIHEIAERLENKKLTLLRLCLSGFILGGTSRLIQVYLLESAPYLLLVILQALGGVILLMSLQQLWMISRRVKRDKLLKEVFNDELTAQTKLKSRQAGFFALLVTQLALIPLSLIITVDGQMAAELSIFVGVGIALSVYIVQEELLAITLFSMDVDEEKYEVWNWRKLSFFHYIINPGVAVGELIMGQRTPKVILIDKHSPKAFVQRSYVPCPSCETMHNASVWSIQNKTANKNWYGLYCPSCGETIPCLRNGFSWILIMLTYPLWFWKKEDWKAKWLKKQKKRFANYNGDPIELNKLIWWKMGAIFAGVMFVLMTVVFKAITLFFVDVEGDYMSHFFDVKFLIVSAFSWALGGLVFALVMKYYLGKKGTGMSSETESQVS